LEFTESEQLKIESADPLIEGIQQALSTIEGSEDPQVQGPTQPDVYKLMLLDKLENVVARDQAVNETIYNVLLRRLETAKITQRLQASKEGTRYDVINPPLIPHQPFQPNKFLLAVMGLITGTIIGFGLVVAAEFLDKSFIDVEEAKYFFGEPLLGAISKIHTEDTVKLEKEKLRWVYSLTLVGGVVCVFVTQAVTKLLNG